MKIAKRLGSVKPSATFAMAAEATALRQQGRDVVDLSVGEPDFDTPEHVKAAARDAMARGLTKYTPIGGLDVLKDAIVGKLRRDNGLAYARPEVMASCGGKHALYTAFQALFDEGDEVVLPAPYWVSYPDMLVLAGAVPRIVETSAADGFRMSAAQLEAAIGPRTVAVIVNSPSNPTGAAYAAEQLRALGEVAARRGLVVITDDIY
jgi:aspartate aminotransferase